MVQAAIARWSLAGISAAQIKELQQTQYEVADIPTSTMLGMTQTNQITIDSNAAGYGWYIDASAGNAAFTQQVASTELHANSSSPAFGRIDLLTVVMHEMGHELGLPDLDPQSDPTSLMDGQLATGVRRLPSADLVAQTNLGGVPAGVTLAETAAGLTSSQQTTQAADSLFGQVDLDLSTVGATAEAYATSSPALVQQLTSFAPVQVAGASVSSATATALPPSSLRVARSSNGNGSQKFSDQVDSVFGSLGNLDG